MRTITTKLDGGRSLKTRTDTGDVRYCKVWLYVPNMPPLIMSGPWPNGIAREKHNEALQKLRRAPYGVVCHATS